MGAVWKTIAITTLVWEPQNPETVAGRTIHDWVYFSEPEGATGRTKGMAPLAARSLQSVSRRPQRTQAEAYEGFDYIGSRNYMFGQIPFVWVLGS